MKTRLLAILLVLMFAVSLAACSDIRIPDETQTDTTPAPTETTAVPEITQTDAPKSAVEVRDAFRETRQFEDGSHEYAVPAVYIDGEEVKDANELIWSEQYEAVYTDYVAYIDDNEECETPDISELTYTYSVANGILSVMMYYRGYYSALEVFRPYNILISEKRLATRAEVAAAFGLTEGEYLDKAALLMGSTLYEDLRGYLESVEGEPELKNEAYQLLWQTVSQENVEAAVPFVSGDGGLSICAKLYSPAGAGYYYALIPIDTPISDDYLSVLDANS